MEGRRMFSSRLRPKTFLILTLAMVTAYYLLFSGPAPRFHTVPYGHGQSQEGDGQAPEQASPDQHQPVTPEDAKDGYFDNKDNQAPPIPEEDTSPAKQPWDMTADELRDWSDPEDPEDPNDVEPGYEMDGKARDPPAIGRLQHEKDMRKEWRHAYKVTAE